jgi:excisionase family DNA binding protein
MDVIDVNADASLGSLLTIDEVAHALKLSSATVRRRISDGQLEAVRVGRGEGRSIRVPSRAVDALLVPVAIAERDDG